ncbi:hypothetical protein [Flavobacterium hercynium]|uniref:Uncharacterized protein n=1 Tax=Flavobacterium hercynium TaxID=387094 RepID=A0A226GS39_9FLAO|nr:hypothetical protein [Flavobacterium hercynium]OXA84869.1 hypothetical protein B0A66_20500 [Flavobacterium hercynium]SMP22023.1 hypothetical protein SAMN06265346_107120 [Flavobacterium hercynium]
MHKISADPMDLFSILYNKTGLKSGSTISAEPMALYNVLKTLQENVTILNHSKNKTMPPK